MRVEVNSVVFGYGRRGPDVLKGITLVAEPGQFLGIIGPNGSGKSTLLRVMGGVARPRRGQVLYDGTDITSLAPREAARMVAAVGDSERPIFSYSVQQVVLMGRAPYSGALAGDTADDVRVAQTAMERTGVRHLADRKITQLSSGERQRVLIARALAQQPKVLLLDEPTSHLDVNFQAEIMELAVSLAHDSGITTVAVLHDLNLTGKYCDEVAMLSSGSLVASGSPREVLTEENLLEVYGVKAVVGRRPELDRPAIFIISGSPRKNVEGRARVDAP